MKNEEKSKQLGIPFGTATSKLRKNILFWLLTRLDETTCFKCGKEIETVDDLTIEHKQPWLHVSVDLFWDLDNIAFSHSACNKPDRPYRGPSKRKIKAPEGMAWCYKHQDFLPIENFSRSSKNWTGYKEVCKKHHHYYRK